MSYLAVTNKEIAAIESGPAITQINELPYRCTEIGALILIMMITLLVLDARYKSCSAGRVTTM